MRHDPSRLAILAARVALYRELAPSERTPESERRVLLDLAAKYSEVAQAETGLIGSDAVVAAVAAELRRLAESGEWRRASDE